MAAGHHREFSIAKINPIYAQFYAQQNKSNLVSKQIKFSVDISNRSNHNYYKMAACRNFEFLRAKINHIRVQFHNQQNKSNLL